MVIQIEQDPPAENMDCYLENSTAIFAAREAF